MEQFKIISGPHWDLLTLKKHTNKIHLRRTPCVRLLLYGNINLLVFCCMGLLIYYKLTGIF